MDHYPLGAPWASARRWRSARPPRCATALPDSPDLPTVLVTGDGSLGFYPAELHAAALAGLRLVIIVGNDGAWGTEVHEQRMSIGRSLNTELGQLPYERLAEAFACKGISVQRTDELQPALAQAFAENGPVLINVLLDGEAGAQLKSDPLLRMILFSDLAEGRRAIGLSDD
jgi:acetolactate synthase-1/2/3 large subunit